MNELLARMVNLQQFIQGGHGSKSRAYQPSDSTQPASGFNDMGPGGAETSLYEEMRMLKATQQAILSQIGGVAEATS